MPKQEMQETWVDPWVWKTPWRRKWQLTPISVPGKFHGQRSLVGYIPEGHKEWNTTECVHVRACARAHTHIHTHISWKSSRLELRKEKKKTFKYINEWIKLSTALSHLHGNQTSDGNIWKQKEIFMSNTIRGKKKKKAATIYPRMEGWTGLEVLFHWIWDQLTHVPKQTSCTWRQKDQCHYLLMI